MHILIVCTGNTCRSPMAEALLRRQLDAHGMEEVEVSSAGTGAFDGAPASEGSYLVALEHGLDLSAHRARRLTQQLVAGSDLVLTMSAHHVERVAELGGASKVMMLGSYAGRNGEDAAVNDPYGAALEEYRQTYRELEQLVDATVSRLQAERSDGQR